jgi:hypothetical protein
MSRIRTFNPEFWTDSKTGTLSPLAKCLFLGILNQCDDFGIAKLDLYEFKARILPYEKGEPEEVINGLIEEIMRKCLVDKFAIKEMTNTFIDYLQVKNFEKYQTIVDNSQPAFIAGWESGFNTEKFLESQKGKYKRIYEEDCNGCSYEFDLEVLELQLEEDK